MTDGMVGRWHNRSSFTFLLPHQPPFHLRGRMNTGMHLWHCKKSQVMCIASHFFVQSFLSCRAHAEHISCGLAQKCWPNASVIFMIFYVYDLINEEQTLPRLLNVVPRLLRDWLSDWGLSGKRYFGQPPYNFIYIHACIHTYIHPCMHASMHTYIHTHIHTYIHTYIFWTGFNEFGSIIAGSHFIQIHLLGKPFSSLPILEEFWENGSRWINFILGSNFTQFPLLDSLTVGETWIWLSCEYNITFFLKSNFILSMFCWR